MNIRLVRVVFVTCAALMLLAAPAAHAQTRVPPPGDDVNFPVAIALNGSKTVLGIEEATEDFSIVTACDPETVSTNSVWFRFVLNSNATLDIDSGGSIVVVEGIAFRYVVLSVYLLDVGSFYEQDCVADHNARLTDVSLMPGEYLVRLAWDGSMPPDGPSQYRLSVRARSIGELLQDYSFEENDLGFVWKVKKAGNPPQIFRNCTVGCTVRFDGVAGGKLHQPVVFDPAALKFKAGDLLEARFGVNNTPALGSDVKVTLQITYSNGTPATKVSSVQHVTVPNTIGYDIPTTLAEIKSKAVKSVKVIVSSPDVDDTFNVVVGSLKMYAGTSVRGALPLPPNP